MMKKKSGAWRSIYITNPDQKAVYRALQSGKWYSIALNRQNFQTLSAGWLSKESMKEVYLYGIVASSAGTAMVVMTILAIDWLSGKL